MAKSSVEGKGFRGLIMSRVSYSVDEVKGVGRLCARQTEEQNRKSFGRRGTRRSRRSCRRGLPGD